MLQVLWHPSAYVSSISDVEGLDARQAQRVRSQLETLGYRYYRLGYVWTALNRKGYRLIALAVVPVWLVLLAIVSAAGFAPGPIGMQGYAALSAVVAMIPVIAVVFVLLEPTGQFSGIGVQTITGGVVIAFFFAVAVFEAAAGEAYDSHFLPTTGWVSAVILGLVVSPAAVAWLPAAAGVVSIRLFRRSRQMIRHDPLLAALDSLLLVRYDLKSSSGYNGMPRRLYHCRQVEFAARCLSQDLLPQSSIGYLGSGEWLTRKATGWAEAIRHTQRQIIAPVPGGQGKLGALLTHEIRCLASGDLGALAWREPPPPPSRRTTLRRRAISTMRAIVVAALPLAVVVTAQPCLPSAIPQPQARPRLPRASPGVVNERDTVGTRSSSGHARGRLQCLAAAISPTLADERLLTVLARHHRWRTDARSGQLRKGRSRTSGRASYLYLSPLRSALGALGASACRVRNG